jgi:integrase
MLPYRNLRRQQVPRANLTAASVEKIKPPATGQIEHYDRRLPGFGLRVSYHGSKSWFLMTRLDGRLVRVTLGKYPALSLADARDQARSAARLAMEGKDPRALRADGKQARQQERQNTFGTCAADFLERYAMRRLRPSTQREYRRILMGDDTNSWRDKPLAYIAKRDVLDVIDAIDQRGSPGASKRALAYLRKFFNWCAERDIIAAPPTDRIPPPHPEVKRDRVLSEDELRYLLIALDKDTTVFGPFIRILLLTGQRRAEVAGLCWSELRKLGGEDAIWEIPGHRTKNKQSHIVPLSNPVRDILGGLPRIVDLAFTTNGNRPISGFGKAKMRLDQRITTLRAADGLGPMASWVLHDLRRTMVTMMNERLQVPPHVVEAAVNHASGLAKAGVAGVYNRALYLGERRHALNRWAAYVLALAPGQLRHPALAEGPAAIATSCAA